MKKRMKVPAGEKDSAYTHKHPHFIIIIFIKKGSSERARQEQNGV